MKKPHPSQTRCPKCNANQWVYADRLQLNGGKQRCPCGHEFDPHAGKVTEYVTADEKRERQA